MTNMYLLWKPLEAICSVPEAMLTIRLTKPVFPGSVKVTLITLPLVLVRMRFSPLSLFRIQFVAASILERVVSVELTQLNAFQLTNMVDEKSHVHVPPPLLRRLENATFV